MSNEVYRSLTIEIMQSDWSKSHEYFLPIRVHNLSLAMLKFVYDSRSFWLMPTFQRQFQPTFPFQPDYDRLDDRYRGQSRSKQSRKGLLIILNIPLYVRPPILE